MNAEARSSPAPAVPEPRIRAATPADAPGIAAFLSAAGLPTADLATSAPLLWIAGSGTAVVGVAGVEVHGASALLRSLAVAFGSRGHGLGARLVDRAEREAARAGVTELVLLTETAADFFAGLGYRGVPRESVPEAIRASAEFRALCPAAAVCMRKALP
jgi:amino-acid N-acetyltransferase